MKKLIILIACITFLISENSFANQIPRPLASDNRIKMVSYDPDNVVTIIGNHLITTDIRFDEEENILDIENGDPIAWTYTFNNKIPSMFTLKPSLLISDTNLTVVTDKHIYHFRLMTRPEDTPVSKDVTYSVLFKYPEEERAKMNQEFNNLSQVFLGHTSTCNPLNDDYSFTGSAALAPIKAMDNGTFTMLEFPPHAVIPAIFSVDNACNESLVNFHVQGNIVFIQGIYHRYTLRNGENVTTVYNDGYPA